MGEARVGEICCNWVVDFFMCLFQMILFIRYFFSARVAQTPLLLQKQNDYLELFGSSSQRQNTFGKK